MENLLCLGVPIFKHTTVAYKGRKFEQVNIFQKKTF